jgi:hypothetical protein
MARIHAGTYVWGYLLHLEEETHILKTSLFVAFAELFQNYHLQMKVNKNIQKHIQCFISQLVNSSLHSWQSFSFTTWPQKHSTSAYIFLEVFLPVLTDWLLRGLFSLEPLLADRLV